VSRFFFLLAFSTLSLFAQQVENAVVVGSVLDPTNAAVSGAIVTLTHLGTDSRIQVLSGDRGEYRTPPLRIGEYTISIEAAGFKRFNQRGIVLDIGDVRQVDAVLQVGQVSDSVNVDAAAPLLQTSDATVGTVIGNQQITNLPLNGRDYLQLAALSAGTIPSTTTVNGQQVGISIGGQAGAAAAFLLDGIDNNTQTIMPTHGNQKEVIKPSIDAIQEFKVVTNLYSAEYGRSSSGVVSVSIKSGTNEIHGAAFEFLRNEALDAKNFFATRKSPFKRNQFGAAAGGPIIRNKLFIFGDFEIGRIRQSATQVDTVPTLAERNGVFPTAIYDPATYNAATKTRTAFAGNQIPASMWDTVAAKVLNWYPLPTNSGATNNFVYASPQNQDPRHWDVRGDDILSERQNLFFRYSSQTQDYGTVAAFPQIPGVGYVGAAGASRIDSHGFGAGYNLVISPTLIASVRAGWNYLLMYQFYGGDQNLSSVVGIPGVDQNYPGLANLTLTGFTPLGVTNTPNTSGSQDRQLSGDVTWNHGTHNIKVGVQAYWLQTNFLSSQQIGGIFNFTGQFTQNPATASGGSALADFLLGAASSSSLSDWAYLQFRTPFTDFFVQDDWKISRHLTLNFGLRYDLDRPPVEKNDKIVNFDIDSNPASPQLVPAGSEGSSRADRALQGVDYHQFAPRFGFAYSLPDNKTVFRGGYGIFYSNLTTAGGMQSMEINPPNHLRVNLTTNPTVPTLFLDQGFPEGTLSPAHAKNVELVSYDRSGTWPMAQEWNFNIQRELPGGILLEAGYYGNKLDHMWRQFDGNPAAPVAGNVNANRLYTSVLVPDTSNSVTLADVVRIQKDGFSRYHALQVKVEKRYAKGLTLLGVYSFSKTIALGDTNNLQNPLDWAAERAVSTQDLTHRFVASAVYELPFGRGKAWGAHWNRFINAALGGWSIAPIVTVDSGFPLNLTVNGNPSNSGPFGADRPNVVGDWHLSNPTVQEWFNTAAFAKNAPYTYGNAGRNVLRGPGLFNLDLAAHKQFRITERFTAQLRLESFNATNTPPLSAPNTIVGSPQFGQISSAGTPRDNQIGLKILF
jgi:Carboxypeptidase regulatory-like domain